MASNDIAVIGLACKYPKSGNISDFWENLCQKNDCITRGPESKERNVISAFGSIDNPYGFDNDFFKCSERDAMSIAPQERLALQLAYAALEDAGCAPETATARIGIVCGAAENEYHHQKMKFIEKYEPELHMAERLNTGASLTSRIAFKLNLKGPAMVVDTACSTSLSAIHLASCFLRNDEADVMLAGGVCVLLNQENYNSVESVMSSDGYTRAYDQKGTGFVPGNGGGIVVLKMLDKAIKDGDHIYAVIKGGAVNNDGSNKVGYTAPSVPGQVEVINRALINAGLEASQIDYIEGHGTATVLGDAVEIRALKKVYGRTKDKTIGIGSLKSNFGHLNSAAGVAGFMKCVLALANKYIPATIHVENPNNELGNKTNLTIQTEPRILETRSEKYRVAVSSIGIGGSNAHVILEEYSDQRPIDCETNESIGLFLLSNKVSAKLQLQANELVNYIQNTKVPVDRTMYTLASCRYHHNQRMYMTCHKNQCDNISPIYSLDSATKLQKVMLFPGTGTSYDGLGRELYENNKVYRKYYQQCVNAFKDQYPMIDFVADKSDEMACVRIVVTEYSLAMALIELGVVPDVLLGYSLGEYVAAAVSGILSIDDVIAIVYERVKVINKLQNAHMFLLATGADAVKDVLCDGIYIAGYNAHDRCLMTCNDREYDKLISFFKEQSIFYQELGIRSPGHSKELSVVEDQLIPLFNKISFNKGKYKIVSTFYGRFIDNEMACVNYWIDQMKNPVLFTDAISTVYTDCSQNVFIHIGADAGLINYIRRDYGKKCNVVELLRQGEETSVFLQGLGKLWCLGEDIKMQCLVDENSRYKVSLPHYKFNEISYDIITYFKKKYEDEDLQQDTETDSAKSVHNPTDVYEPELSDEDKVVKLILEVTGLQSIDKNDEVAALGVDSLSVIMIQTKLQSEFNCDISIKELYGCNKVSDLIELVVSKAQIQDETQNETKNDEIKDLSELFKLTD